MLWNAAHDESFASNLEACRKLARLGLLLALATALYVVEAQLPALPLPGARLGLANLVSLLVLYGWGWRDAMMIGILRQLLGGMFTGTLFGMPFFFGCAGSVLSVVVMAVPVIISRRTIHPLWVSLLGAVAHNLAQLGVAYAFIRQPSVLAYLPLLLYFALPAGAIVGCLAAILLPVLREELVPVAVTEVLGDLASSPPSPTRHHRWLYPAIATLICVLVVGVYSGWRYVSAEPEPVVGQYARVMVSGREVAYLPLTKAQEYEVPLTTGHLVVRIEEGSARVVEADCPDQLCIHTGRVHRPGQAVVCVPNRVSIEVVREDNTEQDVDAMTW